MSITKKTILALLATVGICFLGFRALFPYGLRPCTVPCLMSALLLYAEDHNGEFPRNIAELYPSYTNFKILAGLSGDVLAVKQALKSGESITELTSWRYVHKPGITPQDDGLLVYDVTINCDAGGRRLFSHGRFVGLNNGTFKRIPINEWNAFFNQQK